MLESNSYNPATQSSNMIVKVTYPVAGPGYVAWAQNVNGKVFFAMDNGSQGEELWVLVGNNAVQLSNVNPSGDSYPDYPVYVGGLYYFRAYSPSLGDELWCTDGASAANTRLVKDINSGSSYSSPQNLTSFNNLLYFTANDGTNGYELWRSDGTTNGTFMVADLIPGFGSSYPSDFQVLNGKLIFTVDEDFDYSVWAYNPAGGTTTRLSALWYDRPIICSYGKEAMFRGGNGGLWRTDGTTNGTWQITTDAQSFYPLTEFNGSLFFQAYGRLAGYEPWLRTPELIPGQLGWVPTNVNVVPLNATNTPTIFPASGYCWDYTDSNNPKLYWQSPGTYRMSWPLQGGGTYITYVTISELPETFVSVGDEVIPPSTVNLSNQFSSPIFTPPNSAYWHGPTKKVYATTPGTFTIQWGNLCPQISQRVTATWPTNPARYQTHIAGSQTNNLVVWGSGSTASLLYSEPGTGVDSELISNNRVFAAAGAGRSLVLLSPGSPQQTNIYFQFIQSYPWSDTNVLTEDVAEIGSPIPTSPYHNAAFGGPFVVNVQSRYCALSNYYDRATRTGPIIPVNRDSVATNADDLVLVYYQAGTKLWNPASQSTLSTTNIGWPYKPVRYRCSWPTNADRLVIASQRGASIAGLNNPRIYWQNDPAQPGFNPNDEHAFFWPSASTEPRLRVDRTNLMVLEGGVAQAAISVTQPLSDNAILTISAARDGATNLLASFSPTGIVTEATLTPLNPNQLVYFLSTPSPTNTETIAETTIFTLRASGGLFDSRQIAVREADTNALSIAMDGLAVTVNEGGSSTVNVRLTKAPASNVILNLAKTFETNCVIAFQPAQLTFTSGNWATAQQITIQSTPDAGSVDGSALLSVGASGGLTGTNFIEISEADTNAPPTAIFALRDDLGDRPGTSTPQYSEPFILIAHDTVGGPALKAYRVVAEEAPYSFLFTNNVAGQQIQPPYPLGMKFFGWHTNSYATNTTIAWQDRKRFWWAKAAGANGGISNIIMKFFYPVMDASFYFPEGSHFGQAVPWLDRRTNGTPGIPTDVTYQIRWPDDVPRLLVGESLVKAKFGLPNIRGQTSADVIYEQSAARGFGVGSSARVIDAGFMHEASLTTLPSDMEGKMATNLLTGDVYFTPLSPHLRQRFYWSPNSLKLRFYGTFVDEFGTVEPVGYLMLNVLTGRDTNELSDLSPTHNPAYVAALQDLASSAKAGAPRFVPTNSIQRPTDVFAVTAGLASSTGYVSIALNNSINPTQGYPADRGTPVSIQIIQVATPQYQGETKVIYPADPFDERVTLRHSGDFAGKADGYEFRWQHHPPGLSKPATDSPLWDQNVFVQQLGAVDTVIHDAGARTLSDWWYRCQWRSTNTANAAGTNWSAWTEPALVEGWSKRVLRSINFFDQKYTNLVASSVDTLVNVISQSGARWIGATPLDAEAAKNFGLIEIYETVLKRGIGLSIESGVNDFGANRALLLVAGQLANIYLLLGNEAYADAADPTIGFVTSGAGAGQYGVEATSVHCFMDQAGIDSLLAEELALLEGVDDSFGRNVRSHPIYNRLPPNMGPAFQAQPAYVLNYQITSTNGSPTAADALRIWPQGHGDAWGHYLTAVKNFYRLLRNENFTWTVSQEFVRLAGSSTDVPVNYQHERKFAEAAAAKARTGAELVNLTYRRRYVENPDGQWQGYLDSNTNRAWGLSEWASRAGQGAYFDWVVGNCLLPPVTTDTNQIKVDRTTVTELREVAAALTSIQDELDKADTGLNPLGLAKNVIPFDIDPAQIDLGKTHFEQIYDRAVRAMNNAIGVFNRANTSTQNLREQADNVTQFQQTVAEREMDFNNRLIETFGYPYPDDPAFAGNPNVPDLFHYMYSDYSDITGEVTPGYVTFVVTNVDYVVSPEGNIARVPIPVTYNAAANGFGFVKPTSWTNPRRAPGEVQMAHSELLQGTGRFKRAIQEYENLLQQIEDQATLLKAQYDVNAEEISLLQAGAATQDNLNAAIRRSRSRQFLFQTAAKIATMRANAVAESAPTTFGVIAGMAGGVITDPGFGVRAASLFSASVISEVLSAAGNVESLIELDHQQAKEAAQTLQSITLTTLHQELAIQQQVAQLEQLVRQEALLRLEIYNQQEAMQQSGGRYAGALARGQRLLEERFRFRQQTAQRVTDYRYKDMAFRVFRNEAIQQYRAAFDIASRYVYLATAAYDYETNLRDSETRWKPGSTIMTDIVRARSIGVIGSDGQPQPGPGAGHRGDGGLAASLYDLNFNWSDNQRNLKGQLGFNNPAREHLTFSLRFGCFRALTNDSGDASWRAWLKSYQVANAAANPEFSRYCKPPNEFGLNGRNEPAIIIPFSTAIKYRYNFFGWPEAGGGANFSSSYFTTKIKGLSVRFVGYDGINLSSTPYVYVVPVGNDFLLPPITTGVTQPRGWKILDEFLPASLSVTNAQSQFPNPSWIPIAEMEGPNSIFAIRRYAQMRAYHDGPVNGNPTSPELESYKRLIGRSVWNDRWLLVILGGDLKGADPRQGIQTFINGANANSEGVADILLDFFTYSYSGN